MNDFKVNYEINTICRACLTRKGELRSIFDSLLCDMFRSVARVQIEKDDGLPQVVCYQCVLSVSRSFRFQDQCVKSDTRLRAFLETRSRDSEHPTENTQELKSRISRDPEDIEDNNENGQHVVQEDFDEVIHYETAETVDSNESIFLMNDEAFNDDPGERQEEEIQTSDQLEIDGDESHSLLCRICQKKFTKTKQLRRHLKIHEENKPHKCTECGKTFAESSNLTKHMRRHTGELRNKAERLYTCELCGNRYKWATSLAKHMHYHTKKKILKCPHCPNIYVENRSLEVHIRTHTGERPFSCDYCNKSFSQSSNLVKHVRTHTGEKPFQCPHCDKIFTQSGNLTNHIRIHTGEKPFQCHECEKSFSGRNSLTAHQRIHSGERPFTCNIDGCVKSFTKLGTVIVHRKTHSGESSLYRNDENPLSCPTCSMNFDTSSLLKVHLETQCPQMQSAGADLQNTSNTGINELTNEIFVYDSNCAGSDGDLVEDCQVITEIIQEGISEINSHLEQQQNQIV